MHHQIDLNLHTNEGKKRRSEKLGGFYLVIQKIQINLGLNANKLTLSTKTNLSDIIPILILSKHKS